MITNNRGTCSSKHALLKQLADSNGLSVKLVLGIYKMSESNTLGLNFTLKTHDLAYLPEAHCYLEIDGQRQDYTSPTASIARIVYDLLHEEYISAENIGNYKVDCHKAFLKQWLSTSNLSLSFDELWVIREQCIVALSND